MVVVPTYNEGENIEALLGRVLNLEPLFEVLVVDDNSPDGTGEIVEQMARGEERLRVIHRSGKMGLGTAYARAFGWALKRNYEFVFQMDADFSHNPKDLLPLLKAAEEADLVIGSRLVEGGGVEGWRGWRRILSRGGNLYTRLLTGLPVRDCTSGFRCFRREVLEEVEVEEVGSEGYAFQIEIVAEVWKKGFEIREVPITFRGRSRGESKLSGAVVLEGILLPWRLRLKGIYEREIDDRRQ